MGYLHGGVGGEKVIRHRFDVDALLAGCTLPVCAVRRRGEPVFPARQPDGRRHQRSGVHVSASDADFGEFPRQVGEAAAFLRAEAGQVQRLVEWPGVEGVDLDFGVERRDVAVQCDRLTPELVRLAGSLGLGIERRSTGPPLRPQTPNPMLHLTGTASRLPSTEAPWHGPGR